MNYEEKLKILKKDLDKATSLKYKAEARLEQLNNQEKELVEEMTRMGIKPENLEEEIMNLKNKIDKLFMEADKLLPKDIL